MSLLFKRNAILLGVCGVASILLINKVKNKSNSCEAILSTRLQRIFFGVTSVVWISQLKPNILPQISKFIAKRLSIFAKYLPDMIQFDYNKLNLFSTKKKGIMAVGCFMGLLSLYRRNQTCHSFINKILINPFSIRLLEFCGYLMPCYCIINTEKTKRNSFTQFMAWSSLIWITNGLSANIGKPIFNFIKLRDIQYFGLLSYSLGLLSPNLNISMQNKSDLVYGIVSIGMIGAFIGYNIGFDNGNIKAYPGLLNMPLLLAYLYVKPEISLYIFSFYWIPNIFYLYYVMGIPEITKIEKNLYLANMAAINQENIDKYNIKYIVEAHDKYKNQQRFDVNYLSLEFEDRSFVNIMDKFDKVNDFISDAIDKEESVVVHCSAGVSRSASLVTAYLINSGYSLQGAIRRMKRLRETYDPNTGFQNQLKEFSLK